jgi:hypothetical protein
MTGNRTDNRQVEDIWAVSKAGNTRTQERNTTEDDKDGPHAQNLNGTSHFYGLRNRSSTNSIVLQANALDQLKLISQPQGVNLNDKTLRGYYYDSTAGQETTVYVIDSGVEQSHSVRFLVLGLHFSRVSFTTPAFKP